MAPRASLILYLRTINLRRAVSTLRYNLRKSRLDRAYQAGIKVSAEFSPGNLIDFSQHDSTLEARFANARLEIAFLAANLARLTWLPGRLPVPYAISPQDWPQVATRLVGSAEGGLRLSSEQAAIDLRPDGEIRLTNQRGEILRSGKPPLCQIAARRGDSEAHWRERTHLERGEIVVGLGLHSGSLNLYGSVHYLWNSDPGGLHAEQTDPLYMPLPVCQHLRCAGSYLVFYENSFPAWAKLGATGAEEIAEIAFEGGALRYYLICAAPEQALQRFSELCGKPALPPRWSLGFHQSRWGYRDAEEIRTIAAGFKQHDLPLSAIHLDIDHQQGNRAFTFDRKRFPDPPGLGGELRAEGIRLVTIVDPGVKIEPGFTLYQQGLAGKHFTTLADGNPLPSAGWAGEIAFPDFTRPATRRWWGDQYAALLQAGVEGFWHDKNEPLAFVASGDPTLPLETRHALDGEPGDHRQAHNLYGLQMNRAAFEGLRRLQPDSRPWIVSRSGWVGNARYAWNWSADIETSWAGLRQTVASLIGLGLSGIPFSGSDIGGFTGNPSPELFVRWFQMACFTAFMRTHSCLGTAQREPWVFGEKYLAILRNFLRLRAALLPYLYSLAWQAAQTGWPLLRPVGWHEPQNQALWQIEDEFLLGDALLVAPVLEPGASQRRVILPVGEWFDFWDGGRYSGPAQVTLPVSLEHLPLFVRSNSLLPMEEDGILVLHLYPHVPSLPKDQTARAGQLYSDLGDGYGPWRLDNFYLQADAERARLSWRTEANSGFEFPYPAISIKIHPAGATDMTVDGKRRKATDAPILLNHPFQALTFTPNHFPG